MAIINSEELPVTKNGHDITEAQETADEAKQETIEINKTLTEVDKRVSDAQSKADESLEKAQEGFDKAEALTEKVDANTGAISTIKQTTAGLQTEVKSKADSSTVTQLANVVASKVSNTDFESNKTQTAELISASVKNKADSSTVTQLADNINLKVDAGDVINQINIDPKGVIISGKKISLDGDVTVSEGFKLKADVFEGETFRGNSFIKAINLKNDNNGVTGESYIDDNGIIVDQTTKYDDVSIKDVTVRTKINDGIVIGTPANVGTKKVIDTSKPFLSLSRLGIMQRDDVGIYYPYLNGKGTGTLSDPNALSSGGIVTTIGVNDLYLGAYGEVKVTDSKGYNTGGKITYKDIKANSFLDSNGNSAYINGKGGGDFSTDGALKANGITPSTTNFYIGVSNEVRIVDEKGNTPAGLTYKNIKANSFVLSGNEAFTSASGYAILRGATDSDIVYLQGSEARVTAHKSGGTYRPIKASAFTVSSSRDFKKNIEDWTGDALKLVNDTRVTEYHMKDENEEIDYKRIGLIVQESPLEIINFNGGDSIDLYEMASILWKSVQELDAKNKALENEKNNLNERLSKIESLLNLD